MTAVDEIRCDVCDETISDGGLWARFRRGLLTRWRRAFRLRLLEWGLTDMAPVDTGWRRQRVDLCGDCWDAVLEEVRERVSGDGGDDQDGADTLGIEPDDLPSAEGSP